MTNESHQDDDTYWPEPRLSPALARDWFRDRIAAREPASLVRLGNSEFSMLGYGSIASWSQTSQALKGWFGRDDFEPHLLEHLAEQLRRAVRHATVVGLPRPSRQRSDEYCKRVRHVFTEHALYTTRQIFTDCGIHRFWQMLLAYRELLSDLPFLGIVGCRDVAARVSATFHIAEVDVFPIPAAPAAPGAFEHLGPHFPDHFNRVCRELEVPYRGAVFIIGAGGLGKIYANLIHERGGIAIDIGSALDGWAMQPTRGFLRQDPDLFSLEPYGQSEGWEPKLLMERYRRLIGRVYYGARPTDEEIAFYQE